MTNEQTIEAVMNAAESLVSADIERLKLDSDASADACTDAYDGLLTLITAALAAKDAEIERLTRWKSTNAPRLDALAGLLDAARADAAKGAEALTSLESERAANAILTAEIERLKAQPAEPAKPEPGEWIEWRGGECPIADGVPFSLKFRTGRKVERDHCASDWRWTKERVSGDIVAYRVLP